MLNEKVHNKKQDPSCSYCPLLEGSMLNVVFFSLQGVDGIGLDRILDVHSLTLEKGRTRCKLSGIFSWYPPPTHHILLLPNSNADLPTFSDIKDPLIQAFAKSKRPFDALKCYAELTQDSDLMSKTEIVSKYKCHIPELVARLKDCAESHRSNAGLCES